MPQKVLRERLLAEDEHRSKLSPMFAKGAVGNSRVAKLTAKLAAAAAREAELLETIEKLKRSKNP